MTETRSLGSAPFSVLDGLRFRGSFSLQLNGDTWGGRSGHLRDIEDGGEKYGVEDHGGDSVSIVQQALATVGTIETMLDRAAARDANRTSQSLAGARQAHHSLLTVINEVSTSDDGPFARIKHDPLRVSELLRHIA